MDQPNTVRNTVITWIFSLLFGAFLGIPFICETFSDPDIIDLPRKRTILCILMMALVVVVIYWLLKRFAQASPLLKSKECNYQIVFLEKQNYTRNLFALSSVIFLCYLPIVVLLYPAATSYDTYSAIYQALGYVKLSSHQPILVTGIYGLFVRIGIFFGNINYGIFLFVLVQSGIMALIFAATVLFLYRLHIPKPLLLLFFLFYSLFVVNPLYASYMNKNTLFAGIVLLLTMMLYNLLHSGTEYLNLRNEILFCVLFFLFSTWISNGIVAFFCLAVFLIVRYRKQVKKVLPIVLVPLIACMIYYGPVMKLSGAQPTEKAESLSVPLQQIVRTAKYHWTDLSDGEQAEIQSFFCAPMKNVIEKYNSKLSDNSKTVSVFWDQSAGSDTMKRFFSLWAQLGLKYPRTYALSFFYNTYGYYDIQPSHNDFIFGYSQDSTVFPVPKNDYISSPNNSKASMVELIKRFCQSYLPWVFGCGFYVWILLLSLFIFLIKRSRNEIGLLVIPLTLLLTFLAGPLVDLRYIYYQVALTPVLITLILRTGTPTVLGDDCKNAV